MQLNLKKECCKIVQISDVHISYPIINDSFKAINDIIVHENPDLIVFSGDTFHRNHSEDDANLLVNSFIKFMENYKVAYTLCFGNHDVEINLSKKEILNLFNSKSSYFIGELGPSKVSRYNINDSKYRDMRYGNFVLDIELQQRTVTRLIIVDSGRYNNHGEDGSLTDDQALFIKSSKLNSVPNLIFFHIPLIEFETLYKSNRVSGLKREDVCYQSDNVGIHKWAIEQNEMIMINCGHDHLNDYSLQTDNVVMNMCPGLCYEEYNENEIRGYRVFEINSTISTNVKRLNEIR